MVFNSLRIEYFSSSVFSSGNTSKREAWIGVFETVVLLTVVPNTRSAKFLNSSSSKIYRNRISFIASRNNSFSLKIMGTSVFIVARNLENSICCLFSSTFLRNAPFNWSVQQSKFSIEPNSLTSFIAVFSPTPGHPGILFYASAISPSISITCSGRSMENFCFISSTPRTSKSPPPNLGL